VEINDLVAVRVRGPDKDASLELGIILTKFNQGNKLLFDVLTKGKVMRVSTLDLGPVNLVRNKEKLDKKWSKQYE